MIMYDFQFIETEPISVSDDVQSPVHASTTRLQQ